MSTPSRCTKNYVNCRRHPESSLTVEQAATVRMAAKNDAALHDFTKESADRKTGLNQKAKQAYTEYYRTLSEEQMAALKENPYDLKGEYLKPDQIRNLSLRQYLNLSAEQKAVEKDRYYETEAEPLPNFKSALATMFVKNGEFFIDESTAWGDQRGAQAPISTLGHFQQCGVRSIENYQESTTWTLSDTFSSEDKMGASCRMNCNCGENYHINAYIDSRDVTSIAQLLFESDS